MAFTQEQVGVATHFGVVMGTITYEDSAGSLVNFPSTAQHYESRGHSRELLSADIINSAGQVAGIVGYDENETCEFTFHVGSGTIANRDGGTWDPAAGTINTGRKLTFTAQTGMPDHFDGEWLITGLGDDFGNTEIGTWNVSARRVPLITDYDGVAAA